jgi:UDP-N-acetylglucosamine 1-carboxyvinyltransferase
MSQFSITGGVPLRGTVCVSGSKNAVLPMMAASILASAPVRLEGVPRLTDVRTLARVLRHLGLRVTPAAGGLLLETVDDTLVCAREDLARSMRASFCVLGPLLARRGSAVVPLPGGCNIGDRPVDLHLKGLAALGASLRVEHGHVFAHAPRLRGTTIDLSGPRGPTVTGIANVLSAAVLARGTTIIIGAALEPEIVDLGHFLNSLGARISGLGTSTIEVTGVDELGGATYRVIPDRIEAATLLLAVAIAGGAATVTGLVPQHLGAVLERLEAAGCCLDVREDSIGIASAGPLRPLDITAEPYPGIPTDVQAQFAALLCLAGGRSTMRDRVFPGRFRHVAELRRLGAQIECRAGMAVISGVDRLSGAEVTACDLRASAALVLAGLAAQGETVVRAIHHLDRGYEKLDEKLIELGARIDRSGSASSCLRHRRPGTACPRPRVPASRARGPAWRRGRGSGQ